MRFINIQRKVFDLLTTLIRLASQSDSIGDMLGPPALAPSTRLPCYVSEIRLHHLLRYNGNVGNEYPSCPLVWDIRSSPTSSKRLTLTSGPLRLPTLTPLDLSRHATNPPFSSVNIICGIFPRPWPIKARNSWGVSMLDVLNAIHRIAVTRITESEWTLLDPKQRDNSVIEFQKRCKLSTDPEFEISKGVRRMDCLCEYSMFAGMEIVNDNLDGRRVVECVLTLDRKRILPGRIPLGMSVPRTLDSKTRTEGGGSRSPATDRTPPNLNGEDGNNPVAAERDDNRPPAPSDNGANQASSVAPATNVRPAVQPVLQRPLDGHDWSTPVRAQHHDRQFPACPDNLANESLINIQSTSVRPNPCPRVVWAQADMSNARRLLAS
jgi:hypothetical protein